MLNFLTPPNALNFAIFIEKENPYSFFRFSFQAILHFYLKNALIFVDIDKGIHKIKCKIAWNEKRIKLCGVSFSMNMANFEDFGGSKSWAQASLSWCVLYCHQTHFPHPYFLETNGGWKIHHVYKWICHFSLTISSAGKVVEVRKKVVIFLQKKYFEITLVN